jgi:hypothetical protein
VTDKYFIFIDSLLLRSPRGVVVDNDGFVFVTGQQSGKIVVISPDGNSAKRYIRFLVSLFWIIFYLQLLIYNNSQVDDLYTFVQDLYVFRYLESGCFPICVTAKYFIFIFIITYCSWIRSCTNVYKSSTWELL